MSEVEDSKQVLVDAFPLLGKNTVVETSHQSFMKTVAQIRKCMRRKGVAHAKGLYRHVYVQVIDVDDDKLAAQALAGDQQAWMDFCEDVVILYAMRMVLFDKPVPIVLTDPSEGIKVASYVSEYVV